ARTVQHREGAHLRVHRPGRSLMNGPFVLGSDSWELKRNDSTMNITTIRQRSTSRLFNLFRPRRRVPLATGRRARFLPWAEALEDRWVPANITINGSDTLDESLGLQNVSSPAPEDANDSDVSLGTLQSGATAFSNRLFNSVASGGLGLSTTF